MVELPDEEQALLTGTAEHCSQLLRQWEAARTGACKWDQEHDQA